jgi:hypothetical protein
MKRLGHALQFQIHRSRLAQHFEWKSTGGVRGETDYGTGSQAAKEVRGIAYRRRDKVGMLSVNAALSSGESTM